VVADTDRIKNLNIGQLADYVAMIGMAEIRLDKGLSAAHSILRLFSDADESRPQELTAWDKSFLKGLYNTYPNDATAAHDEFLLARGLRGFAARQCQNCHRQRDEDPNADCNVAHGYT
jgi:mono/diheme cytochrome c family protein